jgi:hypothetical protein
VAGSAIFPDARKIRGFSRFPLTDGCGPPRASRSGRIPVDVGQPLADWANLSRTTFSEAKVARTRNALDSCRTGTATATTFSTIWLVVNLCHLFVSSLKTSIFVLDCDIYCNKICLIVNSSNYFNYPNFNLHLKPGRKYLILSTLAKNI